MITLAPLISAPTCAACDKGIAQTDYWVGTSCGCVWHPQCRGPSADDKCQAHTAAEKRVFANVTRSTPGCCFRCNKMTDAAEKLCDVCRTELHAQVNRVINREGVSPIRTAYKSIMELPFWYAFFSGIVDETDVAVGGDAADHTHPTVVEFWHKEVLPYLRHATHLTFTDRNEICTIGTLIERAFQGLPPREYTAEHIVEFPAYSDLVSKGHDPADIHRAFKTHVRTCKHTKIVETAAGTYKQSTALNINNTSSFIRELTSAAESGLDHCAVIADAPNALEILRQAGDKVVWCNGRLYSAALMLPIPGLRKHLLDADGNVRPLDVIVPEPAKPRKRRRTKPTKKKKKVVQDQFLPPPLP